MNEKAGVRGSVKGLASAFKGELLTRANVFGAGLVAAAGVLGLGGGFEEAPPHGLVSAQLTPTGAVDKEDSAKVEAIKAGSLKVELGRSFEFEGTRSVEMKVTNTGTRPLDPTSFNLAFKLAGVDAYAQSARMQDGMPGQLSVLNPDVPVDMVVEFKHAGPATLEIYSLEYRTSFLDGTKQWFTKDLIAQVELP